MTITVALPKKVSDDSTVTVEKEFGLKARYNSLYLFGSATDYTVIQTSKITQIRPCGFGVTIILDGLAARTNNISVNVITYNLELHIN